VPPPDPFSLAFSALLRPAHFADLLRTGRRVQAWALLAALLWVSVLLVFLWAIVRPWLSLDSGRTVQGMLLAQVLTLLLIAIANMLAGGESGLLNAVFWMVRSQLAVAPGLTVLLVLGLGLGTLGSQAAVLLLVLAAVVGGLLVGGMLVVALVRRPPANESTAVRWLVAGAALVLTVELGWPGLAAPLERVLLALFAAGIGASMLRPLSWLWQALLSAGLAVAGRLGVHVSALRTLHPVTFDELGLLPLPGLRATLAHACTTELEAGGEWLLEVARHPGWRATASAALRTILQSGRHSHPVLFWLSTSDAGAALLSATIQQRLYANPLLTAYAAFASVEEPGAWLEVIGQHRATIAATASLPGGGAVLALIDAATSVLRADRWPAAMSRLRTLRVPSQGPDDPIWDALETVHSWAADPQASFACEQQQRINELLAELGNLDGWPIALIAAITEHMRYLIRIEQQRGALLV